MSNGDDSHWAGLGQRPGALPPPPPPGDDDDAFEQPPVQRTVDAATAPSAMPVNAFHLPFLRPSSDADEGSDSAADEQPPEENTMPKPRPTPIGGRNLQQRICALLLNTNKSLKRGVMAAQLPDLDTKQLSQALFQVVGAGRAKAVVVDGVKAWAITPVGRAYLKDAGIGTAEPSAEPAAKRPARAKPGKKARKPSAASTAQFAEPHASTALAIRDFEPVVERSFRCGVFSDGAFHLAKNGTQIDLTPAEYAEMCRYQRIAGQLAGH